MGRFYRWLPARAIVSPLLAVYVAFCPTGDGFSWHSRGWFREVVVGELLARTEIPAEVIEQLSSVRLCKCRKRPTLPVKLFLHWNECAYWCLQRQPRLRHQFQAVANVAESLMAGTIRAGIPVGQIPLPYCQLASVKNWRAAGWCQQSPHAEPAPETFFSLRLRDLMPVPPAVAEYSTGLGWGTPQSKWRKPTASPENSKCTGAPFASACRSGVVRR